MAAKGVAREDEVWGTLIVEEEEEEEDDMPIISPGCPTHSGWFQQIKTQ